MSTPRCIRSSIIWRRKRQPGPAAKFDEQIVESQEHAAAFRRTLELVARRFGVLAMVEARHANYYRAALETVKA